MRNGAITRPALGFKRVDPRPGPESDAPPLGVPSHAVQLRQRGKTRRVTQCTGDFIPKRSVKHAWKVLDAANRKPLDPRLCEQLAGTGITGRTRKEEGQEVLAARHGLADFGFDGCGRHRSHEPQHELRLSDFPKVRFLHQLGAWRRVLECPCGKAGEGMNSAECGDPPRLEFFVNSARHEYANWVLTRRSRCFSSHAAAAVRGLHPAEDQAIWLALAPRSRPAQR